MRCLVFAYHDIGCQGLRTLRALNQEICAVMTHEDDAGENVWFGSVKTLAAEIKIPVFTDENIADPEWIEKFHAMKPDIIFSFYYRKMIPELVLALAPKGAFNLHGSLLPKYRGRAPVNWAILKGETETGLTLHHMVAKPDAGDIVAQSKIKIEDTDTAHSVFKKLVPLADEILKETVPLLERGRAPRTPQNHAQATYFGGRKPDDGRIDWIKPSREIYNLIRAVTHPYPGAFGTFQSHKLIVWKASSRKDAHVLKAGTVVQQSPLTVACGSGFLILEQVQAEGKQEVSGAEWAKTSGAKLGTILQ